MTLNYVGSPDGQTSAQNQHQNGKVTLSEVQEGMGPVNVLALIRLERDVERATYEGCTECRKRECQCANARKRRYYRINMLAQDMTGSIHCTLFDKQAEQLLGKTAQQFYEMETASQ